MSANPMKGAYSRQKSTAKKRGIAWEMSFDEWLAVWEASGLIEKRGIGCGKYVMARHGDVGPYRVDNVSIIPCEQNCSDARKNNPRTPLQLAECTAGKGRGWTFVRNAYQVSFARRYIGRFKSQREAEAAYQRVAQDHLLSLANAENQGSNKC